MVIYGLIEVPIHSHIYNMTEIGLVTPYPNEPILGKVCEIH